MERQLLNIFLILIIFVGCQQIEILEDIPTKNSIPFKADTNTSEIIPEPYADIWDYILINNCKCNDNLWYTVGLFVEQHRPGRESPYSWSQTNTISYNPAKHCNAEFAVWASNLSNGIEVNAAMQLVS